MTSLQLPWTSFIHLMALENLLSPTHSLRDSLGPDPQCPPLPWTVRAPCFPRPHSLTQHPPTTQPLPVTSRGEENTALFHVVGKSRKGDMPWRESSVGLESFSLHPSSQSTLWPWPQAVPKTLHAIQSPCLSPRNAPHPDNLPFFTCSEALILKSQLRKALGHWASTPHGSGSSFSHLVPGHLAYLDRKCLKHIQSDKEDFKLETHTDDLASCSPERTCQRECVFCVCCVCMHALT